MKKLLTLLASLLLFSASFSAFAQDKAKPKHEIKPIVSHMELKDGDSVVFLGDSITHQCLYTQYVEDYFYTRYPKKRIRFHNSGVGGDKALDGLIRFDEDVAAFKPKYVTILLGMNDGRYTKIDHAIFDTYERDMAKVLDRIKEIGAVAIPMTPTMHDARAARTTAKRGPAEPRDTYYNGVLAYFGTWLREQAHVRGLGFVDMWGPLNNITMQQRKTAPGFTLISDAVHPGASGQVVMAVAVINDMVEKTPVSSINLAKTKSGKLRAAARGGKVSNFKQGDVISFDFLAEALPWVLPAEAELGYKLTKAGHKHSNEKFRVEGLAVGSYNLSIDGEVVGKYSQAQLGRGIELQSNAKTPQYQQALAVANLNKERNDKAVRLLRNQWRDLKRKRGEASWLAGNKDHKDFAKRKAAYEKWHTGFKANVTKYIALANEYEGKIYAAAQPKSRSYQLTAAK